MFFGLQNPFGKIIFHYEGSFYNQPSTIENEDFARAFLNIWLGDKTSRPKLRKINFLMNCI